MCFFSPFTSRANEDSILAVQVFDQKKFKKKDQGFLGVINIRIGDIIELAADADGIVAPQNQLSVYHAVHARKKLIRKKNKMMKKIK
jgi:hypothetical protein